MIVSLLSEIEIMSITQKNRFPLVLTVASMILLAGSLILWNYSNYTQEKDRLKDELENEKKEKIKKESKKKNQKKQKKKIKIMMASWI